MTAHTNQDLVRKHIMLERRDWQLIKLLASGKKQTPKHNAKWGARVSESEIIRCLISSGLRSTKWVRVVNYDRKAQQHLEIALAHLQRALARTLQQEPRL